MLCVKYTVSHKKWRRHILTITVSYLTKLFFDHLIEKWKFYKTISILWQYTCSWLYSNFTTFTRLTARWDFPVLRFRFTSFDWPTDYIKRKHCISRLFQMDSLIANSSLHNGNYWKCEMILSYVSYTIFYNDIKRFASLFCIICIGLTFLFIHLNKNLSLSFPGKKFFFRNIAHNSKHKGRRITHSSGPFFPPIVSMCDAKVSLMRFHTCLWYYVSPKTPLSLDSGLDCFSYEPVNTRRPRLSFYCGCCSCRVRCPLRALTAEHPWAGCSPLLAQSVDSVWTLNCDWEPGSLMTVGELLVAQAAGV